MRSRTRPRSPPVGEGKFSRSLPVFTRSFAMEPTLNAYWDPEHSLLRGEPAGLPRTRRGGRVIEIMFKTREALIPYLLLVAALAGGLIWHESETVPSLGRTVTTGSVAVGGPFQLIDQDGKPRGSADFRGKYMLIYFGYSFCPDVCPTTLGVMAQALDKMGIDANRIVPIFITIDPARDTPSILKTYMAAFGPRFVGLTGSASAITAVEKDYRVYAKKQPLPGGVYGMDHSSVIYLMGPDGKLVSFYDELIAPDELEKDLRAKI